MVNFRSEEFVNNIKYVPYELDAPIIYPGNNQSQIKSGYRFNIDTSSDIYPADLYNAYLEVNFRIRKKATGAQYAAGDLITLAGDGYSLINTMNVTFNGSIVSSHLNAGSSIDILNKLEYSAAYAAGPATQSMFYPHSTKDSSDTDNSFFNKRALTKEANTPDITLQLNRYPFFQSFKNHVSPLGKVGIEITLENDNDLIHRAAAADEGRVVVTSMRLWVPKLEFNDKGKKWYFNDISSKPNWSFKELTVHQSSSSQQVSGTFNITPNVNKPRYVIIWVQDESSSSNQTKNVYLYDTYSIGADANNVTCSSAQIVLGGDKYIPQVPLNPTTSSTQVYRNALMFADGNNDLLSGTFMNYKSFKLLNGMFCFDLTKQENLLGSYPIEFRYSLTGAPGENYKWLALVISEKDIMIDTMSGRPLIR